MRDQPVDYERPLTPDERLEEFELWTRADERRRVPEGAWLGPVLVLGVSMWIAGILAALGFL